MYPFRQDPRPIVQNQMFQRISLKDYDTYIISKVIKLIIFQEPANTQHPWKCIKCSDLHPVIWNPTDGDSDEYLLPIVLADLY